MGLHPRHGSFPAGQPQPLDAGPALDARHVPGGRDHGMGKATAFRHQLSVPTVGGEAPDLGPPFPAARAHEPIPVRGPAQLQQLRAPGHVVGEGAAAPQGDLAAGVGVVDEPVLPAAVEGALVHQHGPAVGAPRQVADLAGGGPEGAAAGAVQLLHDDVTAFGVRQAATVGRNRARRVPVADRTHLVGGGQEDCVGGWGVAGGAGERKNGGGGSSGHGVGTAPIVAAGRPGTFSAGKTTPASLVRSGTARTVQGRSPSVPPRPAGPLPMPCWPKGSRPASGGRC